jgi:6-phosphogluconolactonase
MSGSTPTVLVHRDADELAAAVAARLVTRLVDVQSARGEASLVLTGGGIARRIYEALAASPARGAVDWRRLDVWWGDERFLPSGDPERNETLAREALLDQVPLDPARVHVMAPSDGPDGDDVDAAAERYVAALAGAARPEDHGPVPTFDVFLLGVGPDGHINSLFPEHPALYDDRPAFAVRNSPKPPPTRISMSFGTTQSAREVWAVVAGEDKARAVTMALSGTGEHQVPAAGARGRERTLWLLDRGAASHLPPGLGRIASP